MNGLIRTQGILGAAVNITRTRNILLIYISQEIFIAFRIGYRHLGLLGLAVPKQPVLMAVIYQYKALLSKRTQHQANAFLFPCIRIFWIDLGDDAFFIGAGVENDFGLIWP